MDDFELQQALEAMAGAVSMNISESSSSFEDTVTRWQKLFGFSSDEAVDRIVRHRNDVTHVVVPAEHWRAVQDEKMLAGYDREAYEFELSSEKQKAALSSTLRSDAVDDASITYLVELKGPLKTVEAVRSAAALDTDPITVSGSSAETWEPVTLCCIDANAKMKLLQRASTEGKGYEPTIIVNPQSMR